jgi:aminocarboxymuconate-semialdehyde decarboxylase
VPIDIHAHYVPPQLVAAVKARGPDIGVRFIPAEGGKEALAFDYGFKVRPFFPHLVEPVAERRRWMAEQQIDHQIVGTWPDIFGYGLPVEQCIAWHRILNDTLAEWTAGNQSQFSWIASVPLTSTAAAAAELARTANAGAVGVIISANIEDANLGECDLDLFWREAEALGLPVLIHPVNVGAAPRTKKFALAQIALYTYDTTLAVGSLLMSGVMDRFPKLKLIWSHGGGTFPYLAGRFDVMHSRMDKAQQGNVARNLPSAYVSRMNYDSIVHSPKVLRFLIETVGIDNVHLGTDYSFPPADLAPLDLLKAAALSTSDSEAISDVNPRRLFSRLRL